jgi:hypothetical protein
MWRQWLSCWHDVGNIAPNDAWKRGRLLMRFYAERPEVHVVLHTV